MPLGSVKLQPTVNVERTFTLNEAGVSATQLMRVKSGCWQSWGGWVQWSPSAFAYTPRVILSWIDLNGQVYTSVGTDDDIYIVTGSTISDITPEVVTTNNTPKFSTTLNSTQVSITDPGSQAIAGLAIQVQTPVSVGGIVVQGGYTVTAVNGPETYTITVLSVATSDAEETGAVPVYTTGSGSVSVNVLLDNHGYVVGSQYAESISTTVGGLTIFGNYLVSSVPDVNNFTIDAATPATSTATASENGGLARILYYNSSLGPGTPSFSYGVGGYGLGPYGEGSVYVPTAGAVPAPLWTLVHWGETLIACPGNGPIYTWTPGTDQTSLAIIANAPTVNGGIFVAMPAQILVAWASSINGVQQPNLVQWSNQLDYTDWAPTVTNQAGNATIPTGSKIVGAIQAPNQALIFTDVDVYSMNYLGGSGTEGAQLVFGFNQIATECGLIAARAAGVLNNIVYWLSPGQIMSLSTNGVNPVPCTVWDVIFQDIDTANLKKIVCGTNSLFNEIIWYYPSLSGGTGENDSYIKFCPIENSWDYGKLIRTAWQDYSPAGNPLGGSSNGLIYQHEIGTNAAGSPLNWSISSGAFMISEGDYMSFVDWMLPDFYYGLINAPSTNQNVVVTVNAFNYANDSAVPSQPLTCTPSGNGELSLRTRGRALQVSMTGIGFARLGNIRYRYAPDGRY